VGLYPAFQELVRQATAMGTDCSGAGVDAKNVCHEFRSRMTSCGKEHIAHTICAKYLRLNLIIA
jgi:hypothetical protein